MTVWVVPKKQQIVCPNCEGSGVDPNDGNVGDSPGNGEMMCTSCGGSANTGVYPVRARIKTLELECVRTRTTQVTSTSRDDETEHNMADWHRVGLVFDPLISQEKRDALAFILMGHDYDFPQKNLTCGGLSDESQWRSPSIGQEDLVSILESQGILGHGWWFRDMGDTFREPSLQSKFTFGGGNLELQAQILKEKRRLELRVEVYKAEQALLEVARRGGDLHEEPDRQAALMRAADVLRSKVEYEKANLNFVLEKASDSFHSYLKLLDQLILLIEEGRGDDQESDDLRESMEPFWDNMTPEERTIARHHNTETK